MICTNYNFTYHKNKLDETGYKINYVVRLIFNSKQFISKSFKNPYQI